MVVNGSDVTGKNVLSPTGRRLAGTVLPGGGYDGMEVVAVSSTGVERIASWRIDDSLGTDYDWILQGLRPGSYTLRFEERTTLAQAQLPPLGYWSGSAPLSPDPEAAEPISVLNGDVFDVDVSVPFGLTVTGKLPGIGAVVRLCDPVAGCIVRLVSDAFKIHRVPAGTYTWEVLHSERLSGFIGVGGYPTDAAHALRVKVNPRLGRPTSAGPSCRPGRRIRPERCCEEPASAIGPGSRSAQCPCLQPGTAWTTGTAITHGQFTLGGLVPGCVPGSASVSRCGVCGPVLPDHAPTVSGYLDATSPTGFTFDADDASPVVDPGTDRRLVRAHHAVPGPRLTSQGRGCSAHSSVTTGSSSRSPGLTGSR